MCSPKDDPAATRPDPLRPIPPFRRICALFCLSAALLVSGSMYGNRSAHAHGQTTPQQPGPAPTQSKSQAKSQAKSPAQPQAKSPAPSSPPPKAEPPPRTHSDKANNSAAAHPPSQPKPEGQGQGPARKPAQDPAQDPGATTAPNSGQNPGQNPSPAQGAAQPPPGLVPPKLIQAVDFVYPKSLQQLDPPPEGRVVVKYVVGIDGVPKELAVVQGVQSDLDRAVLESVGKLRYQAATYEGNPVELVLSIALDVVAPPPPEPDPAEAAKADPAAPKDAAPGSPTTKAAAAEPPPKVEPAAEAPLRIQGVVLQAGMRTPVAGAEVIAIPAPPGLKVGQLRKRRYGDDLNPPWSISDTTAADGRFELRGVPDGRVRIIVLTPGYDRIDYIVELAPREVLDLKSYQEPSRDYPYRTVVRSEREGPIEVSRRTISAEELSKIPGTQGDALKSIQNFPGVARAPFGVGLLVIRGAAPDDSRTFFAQHEIPQLFHFGGLTSVVNSDVLKEIDFLPGNFDSRFGDAIGGIVNVTPRKGRRDGFHGYIDSDLIDTGVLLEGPVGKGSFILSGRRSYIDLILNAVVPKDTEINLAVAPRYWDYQAFFDHPLAGGNLSLRVFGSDDASKILFTSDEDDVSEEQNALETKQTFHRFDLEYSKRWGDTRLMIAPSFRLNYANFNFGGNLRFNLDLKVFNTRAELSHSLSQRLNLRLGTELNVGHFDIRVEAPLPDRGDGAATTESRITRTRLAFTQPSLYATLGIKLNHGLTLYPGMRISLYRGGLNALAGDPRFRFVWQATKRGRLKGGIGTYAQTPSPQRSNDEFGNPRLNLERGLHSSLSWEQQFREEIKGELTLFHKHLWDLSADSTALATNNKGQNRPELYASTGIGRIYGLEFLLRKPLTRNFFGWISYTLMRSERKRTKKDPFVLFEQDQTHILTIIASYKLPRRWQIGGRFRLVSGNPTTPVLDSIFDSTTGTYLAIRGPRNSGRLPVFHQLDLRIDKTWIYKRVRATAYLDIQNLYNAENTEALLYSFNFRESAPITSLPIIPSIGAKLEF